MLLEKTNIPEIKLLTSFPQWDERGFFCETYQAQNLKEVAGIDSVFVQDNESFSLKKGTIRGLHFQFPPYAQDKLIRVVQGALWDVAVDVRPNSETFGHYVGVELSEHNRQQLFLPKGFAHGFCTLEEGTVVLYKVSAFYSPLHIGGIKWDDEALAIAWPLPCSVPILSDQDRKLPSLEKCKPQLESFASFL